MMFHKYILFLLLLIIISESECNKRVKRIVGGIKSAQPPEDDPVVFIHLYERDSRIEGTYDNLTKKYSFYGIHYAESPTGEKRFVRPRYKRLSGDINAIKNGSPCPQPDVNNINNIVGTENCLLLNVLTPTMPDETTGLPVIIWIHGGGFRFGSASQYSSGELNKQKVIFVPIQYRLGTLGIIGNGSKEFSGNLALFDMLAAIRWVHEYIKYFGGNPNMIKIMGHGSGATAAILLSQSKLTEKYITGVIAMSGTVRQPYTIDDDPTVTINEIATINNCKYINETELLKCLRKVKLNDLIKNDNLLQDNRLFGKLMIKSLTGNVGTLPVVETITDHHLLPGFVIENPEKNLQKGYFNKIPLLIGVTKDETANSISIDEITKLWNKSSVFVESLTNSINLNEISNITNPMIKTTEDFLKFKPNLAGINNIMNLGDYIKILTLDTLNPSKLLNNLIEVTTDVLFNLPIYLTAKQWGMHSPSFLYSFEYKSKVSYINSFVNGLPLVNKINMQTENNPKDTIVGHGDELHFLFDIYDIFGQSIPGSKITNKNDLEVREKFTNLIVKFAGLTIDSLYKNDENNLFSSFEDNGNSFIKITDSIKIENDFRYCQLSMWGLQIIPTVTQTCKILTNILIIDQLTKELPKKITNVLPINRNVVGSFAQRGVNKLFGTFGR